jgi:hypothetical protein
MSQLLLTCPATRRRVATGVEANAAGLKRAWSRRIEVRCPFCRGKHAAAIREIYCDNAVRDAFHLTETGSLVRR